MTDTKQQTPNEKPAEPEHEEGHDLIVSTGVPLKARSGFEFHVRPVEPADREALAEFFTHVSREDLRFRFLSPIPEVGDSMLDLLVNVDHDHKEDYVALDLDDRTIIASAMIGASEDKSEAEVAIVVRSDYKHRGMSWTFLKYVIDEARRSGIRMLKSTEDRQNHAAIELEKEMGFSARTCPGDATLIQLEFDLTKVSPSA